MTWFKPLQSSDDDAHRFHPPTFPNPASLHDFLISLHLPAFLSVNTIDISHSRIIPSYDYTLCSWIAHLPRRPLGHRLFPLDISLLLGGARLGRTRQVGAIPVRFISIHRDLDPSFLFVRHLFLCSTQLSHLPDPYPSCRRFAELTTCNTQGAGVLFCETQSTDTLPTAHY